MARQRIVGEICALAAGAPTYIPLLARIVRAHGRAGSVLVARVPAAGPRVHDRVVVAVGRHRPRRVHC
jgi:hypothetical protein